MNHVSLPFKVHHHRERGFVLASSLILLSLLTLMSVAMFYTSRSAIQTSASAQNSTEAYYYAETAINYMSWALINDAEFDSFKGYTGNYIAGAFAEPPEPSNAKNVGDYTELRAYLWHPGVSKNSDGQLMYLDNSPMQNREVCFQDAATFANCIDVTVPKPVQPVMEKISSRLPRYIKLDIDANGNVAPSIPKTPHHTTPVVGEDIPKNGAIIWLSAADANNVDHDIEIFPLDPSDKYNGVAKPETCAGGTLPDCPCTAPKNISPTPPDYSPDPTDPNYNAYMAAQACDANTGQWLSSYSITVYAIGYVNGKPSHMLRSVIAIE